VNNGPGRGNPSELLVRAIDGDRVALGRLLSIVDDGGNAAEELDRLIPGRWPTVVIGITGAPGTGKSTLTDQFVKVLREGSSGSQSRTVAVLCVDPTSPQSGGALLGDRVRMGDHAADAGVLIRSVATRGAGGGLAESIPGVLRVVGAVGFEVVVLETVGVGQIELEIATMADTVVVVVNPGGGDEVQAVKAGVLEIADVLVVNKADLAGVAQTEADLLGALRLSAARSEWNTPVLRTVAGNGEGVRELVDIVMAHTLWLTESGHGELQRHQRNERDLVSRVNAAYLAVAARQCETAGFGALVQQLDEGALSVGDAVRALLSGISAAERPEL
jgi:LAO/AO transport system kinase